MIKISSLNIIVLATLAGIGLFRILYMIAKYSVKEANTYKYLKQFNNWLKTKNGDSVDKLYTWLTQNAGKIQSELRQTGVAANYIPPGKSYTLTNYGIIVNILPLINEGVAIKSEVNACKYALNRHIGNLKHARKRYLLALLNPFKWVLEGVKLIITFPIYLLYWIGFYEYNRVVSAKGSKVFEIISGIGTLIGFVASIIGIIVDWDDLLVFIQRIRK